MYDFEYERAASVDDAIAKLKAADDGLIVAGGMTLIPTMKQRLAQPSQVIDLGGIADLRGITVSGDSVTIGAMTTHDALSRSADLQRSLPVLFRVASIIGVPAVRSEERRVGKECVSTCSSRWSASP